MTIGTRRLEEPEHAGSLLAVRAAHAATCARRLAHQAHHRAISDTDLCGTCVEGKLSRPACVRCGGTEDLRDRGMAPGATYCAPCRRALAEEAARHYHVDDGTPCTCAVTNASVDTGWSCGGTAGRWVAERTEMADEPPF